MTGREGGWRCSFASWAGRLRALCVRGCAFWKRAASGERGAASLAWENFIPESQTWDPTKSICETLAGEACIAGYRRHCGVAGPKRETARGLCCRGSRNRSAAHHLRSSDRGELLSTAEPCGSVRGRSRKRCCRDFSNTLSTVAGSGCGQASPAQISRPPDRSGRRLPDSPRRRIRSRRHFDAGRRLCRLPLGKKQAISGSAECLVG